MDNKSIPKTICNNADEKSVNNLEVPFWILMVSKNRLAKSGAWCLQVMLPCYLIVKVLISLCQNFLQPSLQRPVSGPWSFIPILNERVCHLPRPLVSTIIFNIFSFYTYA